MFETSIYNASNTAASFRGTTRYFLRENTSSPSLAMPSPKRRRVPTKRPRRTYCIRQIPTWHRTIVSMVAMSNCNDLKSPLPRQITARTSPTPISMRPSCLDEATNLRDPKAKSAYSFVERNHRSLTPDLTLDLALVVNVSGFAVENNVQPMTTAATYLEESWHATISGPRYVPLERLVPCMHLLMGNRRLSN